MAETAHGASPRSLVLTVGGRVFDALEWGPPDGPVALLLHGFPQRSTSWTAVAERLAAVGIRSVAPDQRGYSAGARPAGVTSYALPELAADAVGFVGSLAVPVHLVGHDWGGVVGWQVAARHPEVVRTWTAVSTPNPLALDAVLATSAEQREQFAYMRLFRQEGVAEQALLGGGLARMYGGAVATEREADDLAFFAQPGVLTAALNWYRAMSRSDNAGVGRVAVPTTYVWGSGDLAFGRAAAETTGEYVDADYRFVALEGASHWLPDEAPDALAEAIAARVLG